MKTKIKIELLQLNWDLPHSSSQFETFSTWLAQLEALVSHSITHQNLRFFVDNLSKLFHLLLDLLFILLLTLYSDNCLYLLKVANQCVDYTTQQFQFMASAKYFFQNNNYRQVLNLLCYTTEYPHMLTSTQKITRLYRCLLRREKEWTIGENRCDPDDYHRNIVKDRRALQAILHVPQSSAIFGQTLQALQKRVRSGLDPTMLINDSRQYSAVNGRQYVWSDEELRLDPFGYYSKSRIIGHRKPGYGFLYYPDFPTESNVWHLDPPSEYEDNVEEQSFKQ